MSLLFFLHESRNPKQKENVFVQGEESSTLDGFFSRTCPLAIVADTPIFSFINLAYL